MKTKTAKIFLIITLALCFVSSLAACESENGLGHKHSYTKEVTAPTCVSQGYTTYTCSCGESYVDDYVHPDDSNHTYEWTDGTDAGCIATGIKGHYRCPDCGTIFDENKNVLSGDDLTIPAGHTYERVEEKAAACNEVGTKAHYVCKKCEKLFDENKEEVSASDLVIPKTAHSYKDGECENCHAKKPSEGLAYTLVVGSGYAVSIGECTDTDIVIPAYYEGTAVIYVDDFSNSNITSVTIEDGVKYIYEEAFENCASLKSVTLPDSIISIGGSAFENCGEIKEIELPKNLTAIYSSAFKNCDALKSIVIPDSVTWLGNSAFEDCDELKAVTLGKKIETIKEKAFYNCVSLRKIEIPESVKRLENYAFENCTSLTEVTINGKFESFGEYVFRNCSRLKEATIGEGTTYIGSAFSGCDKLERVTLPASIKSLPEEAFGSNIKEIIYNGTVDQWAQISFGRYHDPLNYASVLYINGKPLTEVTLSSATKISKSAFEGCETLTSVIITESVTEIGIYAFNNCPALKSITVAEGNDNFFSVDGILYNKQKHEQKPEIVHVPLAAEGKITIPDSITAIGYREFYGCKSLTGITIPDSVTSIGDYAFSDCEALTSITIPDSVTSIGKGAFYGCSSLKDVKLPEYITEISMYRMFAGCSLLQNIVIPDVVTYISDSAFSGCVSLISVTIPNSVTGISDRAFNGCNKVIEVFNQSNIDNISNYINAEHVYKGTTESTKIENVKDYLFFTDEWGTNYLLGYVGDKTELELPKDYNGKDYKIYEYAFYGLGALERITIPDSITSIGKYAFSDCKSLTSVKIHDNVTSIGEGVFSGCSSLTSVTIPNSVKVIDYYTFSGCESLTSVTIPESIIEIEPFAFSGCSSLASVTILNGVEKIGERAFSGCKSLTRVNIPESVTRIQPNAFDGCLALKDVYYSGIIDQWVQIEFSNENANPLSVAQNFYIGDNRVTEAVINAEKISSYAFYSYLPLTRVTLSRTEEIGGSAFFGCNKLVEVYNYSSSLQDVKKGSTENGCVGYYAEYVYNRTTTVEETKIKKVKDYLFFTDEEGTNYLLGYVGDQTELVLPNDYNGNNYKIYKYAFYGFGALKSITIPNSVTGIGEYAFYECGALTNVTISESVTEIADYAFYDCDGLTNVTIPDSVTKIGEYAFFDCDGLTNVTIPDSVTEIGGYAFNGCDVLSNVTLGKNIKAIGEEAFKWSPIAKVYYGGTKTEWEKIDVLIYAEIYYYSETAPIDRIDYCDHWHYDSGNPVVWANTEE